MTPLPDQVIESRLLNARVGVKMHYVVPVIAAPELAIAAEQIGYEMVVTNPEDFRGRNLNSQIYINNTKGVFGFIGENIETPLENIQKLIKLTNDMYNIHLEDHIDFYEFEVNTIYNTNIDVYIAMSRLFQDSSDMRAIKDIVGAMYSQFSIRLTPASLNINSRDWHEIIIEPKVIGNGKSFISKMIRRSHDFQAVVTAARETEEKVLSIISRVIMK